MMAAHPDGEPSLGQALTACIEAAFSCAQASDACADACMAEETIVELRKCIRLSLDCADLCMTTGRFLSRLNEVDGNLLKTILMACRDFCTTTAIEYEKHADMYAYCRIAAEACRRCEQACQDLLPRPF
ncbi:four-helix bundle copper-binding protein [Arthrobacter sp. H5]|uniref:four-helix bundle copper-binding protein n=1 Tax=Arthrobacter sp. H5 TaxID=1267973 RepID=UPI0020A64E98|nr:four-helix bundle copper-binding protein [Arthrobacter sp. H5]